MHEQLLVMIEKTSDFTFNHKIPLNSDFSIQKNQEI